MQLSSTAFQNGQPIPQQYTGDGVNWSPPLQWREPPAGTQSLALSCEDPDAPRGTFTHWIVFNITPEARGLGEGVPREATVAGGAKQGINDFGKVGYGGPAPPPGTPHRYFFKLYALDAPLNLPSGATQGQLQAAMKGHVLAESKLMGTYGR